MATDINHPKKTILVYGLTGMQLLNLNALAGKIGITCKPISDHQTMLTVEQLLSGKDYPPMPEHPLIGKFALLSGFDGQEQLGTLLINQVASGVIKAVHTKHNNNWHFADLCSEIHKEHQIMKSGK